MTTHNCTPGQEIGPSQSRETCLSEILAELARLRAVNAVLVDALAGFAMGMIIPPLMTEQARQLMQWQDAAREALSRAAQVKPEPETCVWTMDEGEWHTACDNDESFEDCDPINTVFYVYCPFCGKRIEVAEKAEGDKNG